jgi:hypothetical protein
MASRRMAQILILFAEPLQFLCVTECSGYTSSDSTSCAGKQRIAFQQFYTAAFSRGDEEPLRSNSHDYEILVPTVVSTHVLSSGEALHLVYLCVEFLTAANGLLWKAPVSASKFHLEFIVLICSEYGYMQTSAAGMGTAGQSAEIPPCTEFCVMNSFTGIGISPGAIKLNAYLGDHAEAKSLAKVVKTVEDGTSLGRYRIVIESVVRLQSVSGIKNEPYTALVVSITKLTASKESCLMVYCRRIIADTLLTRQRYSMLDIVGVPCVARNGDRPVQMTLLVFHRQNVVMEQISGGSRAFTVADTVAELAVQGDVNVTCRVPPSSMVDVRQTVEQTLALRWKGVIAKTGSLQQPDHRAAANAVTLHVDGAAHTQPGGQVAGTAYLSSCFEFNEYLSHAGSLRHISDTKPAVSPDLTYVGRSCTQHRSNLRHPVLSGRTVTGSAHLAFCHADGVSAHGSVTLPSRFGAPVSRDALNLAHQAVAMHHENLLSAGDTSTWVLSVNGSCDLTAPEPETEEVAPARALCTVKVANSPARWMDRTLHQPATVLTTDERFSVACTDTAMRSLVTLVDNEDLARSLLRVLVALQSFAVTRSRGPQCGSRHSTVRGGDASLRPRLCGFRKLVLQLWMMCGISVVGARGDVDLATLSKPREGLEMWGAAIRDYAGSTVDDAGDVNKDGYQDFLVGAFLDAPSGKTQAGAVYLLFGSPGRSTSNIDTAGSILPRGVKILGATAYDIWGHSTGGAGDVNKDGIDDFIIGGHLFDPPSRTNGGAAVVIFGKTSGWADIDLASFTSGSAGFWIYGAAAGDLFGVSVSGAGDVNGDGIDDVVIGSGGSSLQIGLNTGTSYIIFGHSTATPFGTVDISLFVTGSAGFRVTGVAQSDGSGYSASSAGDVNSDGYGDVIVGAPYYDGPSGRTDSGAAYVIFGHSATTAFTDIDLAALSSSQGFRITGAAASDQLGWCVSSAGDFNHDGYDDVVVGSFANKAYVLLGHGNTSTFANVDLATFVAGSTGFGVFGSGYLGSSVGGGVDVNGDAVDDIVVAAPDYSSNGAAYVLYGRSQLVFSDMNVLSGLPSASGYRIVGFAEIGGNWCVSLLRDFDGDGVGEVLVGTPNADAPSGLYDAGAAYMIYGEMSAPTQQPSRQPTRLPSRQPTSQPTVRPSRQPTGQPSGQPNSWPTSQPSLQPTAQPSRQPTSQPSVQPSRQPSFQPSKQPTGQPSRQPTGRPSPKALKQKTGDVDLATWSKPAQGLDVWGAFAGDNAGYSVADAGDVNKDGYRDILVGASYADIGSKSDAGAAYLTFGSPSRLTSTIDTAASMSPKGIKISGVNAGYYWGTSVSGAGDFNKDGIDDFIIGGPWFGPPTQPYGGAAVVIFGKTSGWADINLASFTSGSAGFWMWGAASNDHCGIAVSGAGDVNGDGAGDVVVGCYLARPYSRYGAGASYVIFGHSTTFATIDLSTLTMGTGGFRISGATDSDWSGYSVSSAGDVNGDGYGDVTVGASNYNGPNGRTLSGAAYVIFGHSAATAFTDIDLAALSSSQGFRITGAAAYDALGNVVGSAGDFNHDGYGDIAILPLRYALLR